MCQDTLWRHHIRKARLKEQHGSKKKKPNPNNKTNKTNPPNPNTPDRPHPTENHTTRKPTQSKPHYICVDGVRVPIREATCQTTSHVKDFVIPALYKHISMAQLICWLYSPCIHSTLTILWPRGDVYNPSSWPQVEKSVISLQMD